MKFFFVLFLINDNYLTLDYDIEPGKSKGVCGYGLKVLIPIQRDCG